MNVADHPGTSETKSKDISPLIEVVAIGDANEAFVEDGGEENNSTKEAPLDGKKTILHQPSPCVANSPTKIMNYMRMGIILMASLFTLTNLLRWQKILICFFENALGDGITEVSKPLSATKTTPSVAHLAVAVALMREQIMSMSVKDLMDELEKRGKTKSAKNITILQECLIGV